jgi:hypothetical protein
VKGISAILDPRSSILYPRVSGLWSLVSKQKRAQTSLGS